ncbi:dTDP-4-dehydrorhamnose reductase [Subtercola lobariae]|uniref:dTDP-4-dehydrorhamnose reductase n=1 Tax=Subtercola lobariae TaxID=1588641 RepID=A0A917B0I2_9MICO|nr:dTDP-4-dehydrorhamnose reductase [Subtercola lobariae]GGF14011.1 NAD(P)-dependent oxidoreductase [Subtercola lobariae]
MTRYLIAGAGGMLGRDLQAALVARGAVVAPHSKGAPRATGGGEISPDTVTALTRAELDIADREAVLRAAEGADVIVNAAAYTKVDDAETHETDAFAVNATGAGNLAVAARENGAAIIQVSTDYVFDGRATTPYAEDSPRNPVSAYGRSKAEGELEVLGEHPLGAYVVRSAWLCGEHGPNFARTMLRLIGERETVSVVTDQHGQPTFTADLAAHLLLLVEREAPVGIYHGTNSGEASWFDFTQALFIEAGIDAARVMPTDSSQFVRPATRPQYSVLGHDAWSRAGIEPMRSWQVALHEATQSGVFGDRWQRFG